MKATEKLRVDLPLVLPHAGNVRDPCVDRLLQSLVGRPGIGEAHVLEEGPDGPKLCLHYDPALLSLTRVRELVHASGARITGRYGHLLLKTDSPLHARGARTIAIRLRECEGVVEAEVGTSGVIRVEYDSSMTTQEALLEKAGRIGARVTVTDEHWLPKPIEDTDSALAESTAPLLPGGRSDVGAATYGLQPSSHEQHDPEHEHKGDHAHDHDHDHEHGAAGHTHAHGGIFGEKSELVFSLIGGVLLACGWAVERYDVGPEWLGIAFYVGAYCAAGYFTVSEAIENLKARRFEIDTLMLVAAAGAAALGKWAEGALLLFLFSLGHSLEHYAMGRARKAIEALAKLAPETATVRREGRTEEVAVKALQVGDVILVRPNERIAADGIVVVGNSSVNQAPVTGESVPVDKQPAQDAPASLAAFEHASAENRVFAGTINGSGAMDIQVARRADQSTMARVVRMVTEAEAQRSPTQQFTERFERIFVPAVLALVGILLFAWVVIDEPFATSFYRAMAVLVAASPCALAISVPSAVLSGVARAGHGGVLVKGGGPLENLGTLSSIAFDKTGTLTEGKPRLTEVVAADGATEDELLAVSLAVEEHSDHPLASAIVNGARERIGARLAPLDVKEVKSITGRGVEGQVDGDKVYIGKPVLFSELSDSTLPQALVDANRRLIESGRTTMIVKRGARFLGVLAVMDTPRPQARQTMLALRHLGIERLIMISGDNQQVADAVAASVGLTEARGDLMPEQKVQEIQNLRKAHGKVAMVGDGVNDAPAMANATVGIAMGAAGSDVALETADVALMADDLSQLPFAVGLSRKTSGIIKQNLWVSLGVVAVLIPATIMGLNIGTAVLFHEGSTLLVVINALRLLAYDGPGSAGKVAVSDDSKSANDAYANVGAK